MNIFFFLIYFLKKKKHLICYSQACNPSWVCLNEFLRPTKMKDLQVEFQNNPLF